MQEFEIALGKIQFAQLAHAAFFFEIADGDLLLVLAAGDGRDAAVDAPLADAQGKATVLGRLPLLTHVGIVLNQAYVAREHFFGRGEERDQFAVDAAAEPRHVVILLDVQIAGSTGDGSVQDPLQSLLGGRVDAGRIDPGHFLRIDLDHIGHTRFRQLSDKGLRSGGCRRAPVAIDDADNGLLVGQDRSEFPRVLRG